MPYIWYIQYNVRNILYFYLEHEHLLGGGMCKWNKTEKYQMCRQQKQTATSKTGKKVLIQKTYYHKTSYNCCDLADTQQLLVLLSLLSGLLTLAP